jgi:hypothetical protein
MGDEARYRDLPWRPVGAGKPWIGAISVIQLGRSVRLRAVSIRKRTARSTATWYPRAALLRM